MCHKYRPSADIIKIIRFPVLIKDKWKNRKLGKKILTDNSQK